MYKKTCKSYTTGKYFVICSAEVVDFTKPSGSHSTHPKLFHWVKTYFENSKLNKLLPTTVNRDETIVQQESGQSDSVIGCSSTCHDTDDLVVIDTDVPVTKKRKLEDNKSETYFIIPNIPLMLIYVP